MKREFYVAYLPLPRGVKRSLLLLVPVVLVGLALIAAVLPTQQVDPGDGVWDLAGVTEYTGVLVAEPYPAVIVPQDEGGVKTVMLASQVKTGVQERVTELAGRVTTVRGNLAEREGRALLTLLDDPAAIEPAEAEARIALPTPEPQGRFQLTGQIIDPKCYLGAMKPGEGKIHKACATLCIKGGIPPMFFTESPDGERTVYLVTGPDGQAILDPIEAYIADPIMAEGTLEQHGDLTWFKIDASTIARLR